MIKFNWLNDKLFECILKVIQSLDEEKIAEAISGKEKGISLEEATAL